MAIESRIQVHIQLS